MGPNRQPAESTNRRGVRSVAGWLFACYFALAVGSVNGLHTCHHEPHVGEVSSFGNGQTPSSLQGERDISSHHPAVHSDGACAACNFVQVNHAPSTLTGTCPSIDEPSPFQPIAPALVPPGQGLASAFLARGPPGFTL